MLRITVELWPGGWADNKQVLATMDIYNDMTGTPTSGNYKGRAYRKGYTGTPLHRRGGVVREGTVLQYPRVRKHVWCLVAQMLRSMGYG